MCVDACPYEAITLVDGKARRQRGAVRRLRHLLGHLRARGHRREERHAAAGFRDDQRLHGRYEQGGGTCMLQEQSNRKSSSPRSWPSCASGARRRAAISPACRACNIRQRGADPGDVLRVGVAALHPVRIQQGRRRRAGLGLPSRRLPLPEGQFLRPAPDLPGAEASAASSASSRTASACRGCRRREGAKYAEVITDFVKDLKALGPQRKLKAKR